MYVSKETAARLWESQPRRHLPSFSPTYLWLATSFAFDLFKRFDRLLAFGVLGWLVWYSGLAVHLHSASPLLGQ